MLLRKEVFSYHPLVQCVSLYKSKINQLWKSGFVYLVATFMIPKLVIPTVEWRQELHLKIFLMSGFALSAVWTNHHLNASKEYLSTGWLKREKSFDNIFSGRWQRHLPAAVWCPFRALRCDPSLL